MKLTMMMEVKRYSYGDFNDIEKIRVYLEYHPEVFTDELMEYLADTYLNYNTVRNAIKEQYPRIVREMIENNEIDIIPSYYGEEYQKGEEQQRH